MIYTLTLNPSLDHHIYLNQLKKGCVNRIGKDLIRPGGKGINVSMVLKKLGMESVASGFLGGFTGEELERHLTEEGISCDFVKLTGQNTRINVKIHEKEDTDVNADGPVIRESDLRTLKQKLCALKDGDFLVISGSVPRSVPDTFYADMLKAISDREIKVIVDASGKLLLNTLKFHPFLIKPNFFELTEIFGTTPEKIRQEGTAGFILAHGKKLQKMGAVNVLVSLGAEGAVLFDEYGEIHKQDAPLGKMINSVGAGDSMVAGFLAGLLKTGDYAKALKYGVCAGSASAFSEEFATFESVRKLMECV